jgi:PPOX class probable FMN-dependent enzyme
MASRAELGNDGPSDRESAMSQRTAAELITPEDVRAHYQEPHPISLAKEMRQLDRHCRDFIALSPFIVVATSDARGRVDATPRGDAPGFVAVADDRTLLIPDRRGNNRVDTMMNIAANPHVGLLFLVPGRPETLRVNGAARITIDAALLAPLAADGKPPQAAIRVSIEEVYFQCGKALLRSHLWDPDRHVARDALAPIGQVFAEQCALDYDPGLETIIQDDYRDNLY